MERNIFEAASNQAKSSRSSASDKDSSHLPERQGSSNYGAGDPEVEKTLARMNEIWNDLEAQLQGLKKKGEEYQFDIFDYLKKNEILISKELEQNSEIKKFFEEKLMSLPTEGCFKKVPKSKAKLTQERKNKSLGSRKKWIPVR